MTKKKIIKATQDAIISIATVTEYWQNPPFVEKEVANIIERLTAIKHFKSTARQLKALEVTANKMGELGLHLEILEDSTGGLYSALDALNEVIDACYRERTYVDDNGKSQ